MNKIVTELKKHGDLFNVSTLVNITKPIEGRNYTDELYSNNRVYYYSSDARSAKDYSFTDSDLVSFKIVKFLNTRNMFSHPWSFGFFRVIDSEGNITWKGAYAGIHAQLFSKLKAAARDKKDAYILKGKVNFPQAITRFDVFNTKLNDVVEQIYTSLYDKDEWGIEWTDQLKSHLKNLLYYVRSQVLFRKDKNKQLNVLAKKNRIKVMFNSGLLDKYMEFITLSFELMLTNSSVFQEPYFAIKSVEVLSWADRDAQKLNLPVLEIVGKCEMMFPSKERIHLSEQSVQHILDSDKDRLIIEARNTNKESLYTSLKYSIELAEKQSKVDSQYLVPYLNLVWESISYLMPLYLPHLDTDTPACAVIIGKTSNGLWAPVTVLNLESAYTNARLLGKVNAKWLSTKYTTKGVNQ